MSARDEGLAVERRYEGVDDVGDAIEGGDGAWRLRAGSRIRVRLTLVCPARRRHLVLVDPLPAGLEIEDRQGAEVEETLDIPTEGASVTRSWRWSSHFRFFDDRVKVHAERLPEGVYTFGYLAVARTPGEYRVPPVRAEERFRPEVRAQAGWGRVVLE